MKLNISGADRIIRVILGLVLIVLLFTVENGWRWGGLFGFILLGTAAMNWCPVYAILGISTRKTGPAHTD